MDDDFTRMWLETNEPEKHLELLQEEQQHTPKQLIRDGHARYRILAEIMLTYYFVKHGTSAEMLETTDTQLHTDLQLGNE